MEISVYLRCFLSSSHTHLSLLTLHHTYTRLAQIMKMEKLDLMLKEVASEDEFVSWWLMVEWVLQNCFCNLSR